MTVNAIQRRAGALARLRIVAGALLAGSVFGGIVLDAATAPHGIDGHAVGMAVALTALATVAWRRRRA